MKKLMFLLLSLFTINVFAQRQPTCPAGTYWTGSRCETGSAPETQSSLYLYQMRGSGSAAN